MSAKTTFKTFMLWGVGTILLSLASYTNAKADSFENALREWDPYVIQGAIMDMGQDYIVVSEQWVILKDTNVKGKIIKTDIIDSKGNHREKGILRKGTLVLAKGGLAWDEKMKANVLLATEIQVLDKQVNLINENARKKHIGQVKPW